MDLFHRVSIRIGKVLTRRLNVSINIGSQPLILIATLNFNLHLTVDATLWSRLPIYWYQISFLDILFDLRKKKKKTIDFPKKMMRCAHMIVEFHVILTRPFSGVSRVREFVF